MTRVRWTVVAVGLLAVGVLLAWRASRPPGPQPAFTTATFTLVDARRHRLIAVYAAVPTGGDRWPVIVFSHGNQSAGAAAAKLFDAWAAHGYLCLAPTHDDSVSMRDAAKAAGATSLPAAGMIEPMGAATASILNRARDLSFLLDSATAVELALPGAEGHVDWKRVGAAGHSSGAYTAQLLAGMAPDMDGVPRTAADPRVRAVLDLAPVGAGQGGLTVDSWRHVTVPLMNVTGSLDLVPRGQFPTQQKRDPFTRSPPGGKFNVFLVGANHGTFLCDPGDGFYLKQLGGSVEQQAVLFDDVRRVTLLFWDAELKGSAAATAELRSGDERRRTDGRVTIEAR